MRLYWGPLAAVAAAMATPAIAGTIQAAPAPLAGVGIGAVMLVGLGYRALRRRIDR